MLRESELSQRPLVRYVVAHGARINERQNAGALIANVPADAAELKRIAFGRAPDLERLTV